MSIESQTLGVIRRSGAEMIGSCPECKEAIRIPEGHLEQRVRCPLCSAEYELASVFEKLPPMLELVGSNSPDVGIQIDSSSDLDLVHADSGDSRPAPGKTYRPQKRKQSSPLWEITKVVLGGVLALPIGVLCVWWFAGRAPFGLSETVSQYVPWIVPENLRKGDSLDDSDLDSKGENSQPENNGVSSSKQKANRLLQDSNQGGGLGLTRSIEGNQPQNSFQLNSDPQKNSSGGGKIRLDDNPKKNQLTPSNGSKDSGSGSTKGKTELKKDAGPNSKPKAKSKEATPTQSNPPERSKVEQSSDEKSGNENAVSGKPKVGTKLEKTQGVKGSDGKSD